jgi:uncharacterized DUF497 family protein
MDELGFEWDEAKSASNKRKHGISFDEAKSAFSDEFGRLIGDPAHSDEDDRFILLGMSAKVRIVVVSHCYRRGNTIRIISARKADPSERAQYEVYRHA